MILSDDILKCDGLVKTSLKPGIELSICSDSRKFSAENCFLSLYGENFDSIKFIPDIVERGALYILIENRNPEKLKLLQEKYSQVEFVIVEDIYKFILNLGSIRSKRFQKNDGLVIGLTGSNGKTTNKEMLKSLLSFLGEEKVHATRGNLNNQIGVPLTLFELEDDQDVAIVEMGTNLPGEIEVLSNCAGPQYGFVTNIGHAHIEFLKDLQGVFKEKTALYRKVVNSKNGLFLVNGFDSLLKDLEGKDSTKTLNENNLEILESGFILTFDGERITVENSNLLGRHQSINMAMCLLLALEIYPQNKNEIVEKARNYTFPKMNRGELLKVGEIEVYLDAYNANPSSMRASLDSFLTYLKDEKVEESLPILGDMNELGQAAPQLHMEVGKLLSEKGFVKAIFIGRYAKDYANGFSGKSECYSSAKEFKSCMHSAIEGFSFLFIKGSRSLQLESIIDINN